MKSRSTASSAGEEYHAVAEYCRRRKAIDPNVTQHEVARSLEYSDPWISRCLAYARDKDNPIVKNAPTPDAGLKLLAVKREAQAEAQEEMLFATLRASKGLPVPPTADELIQAVDFRQWAPNYKGQRFNFIHCDFPYGIGSDKFNQGSANLHGGYADTQAIYRSLCYTLAEHLDKFAAQSCHLMFWFSMNRFSETWNFLQSLSGFEFEEHPLIWHKNDNQGILPRPQHGPRRLYESAFFGWRGDRKIITPVGNIFEDKTDKSIHSTIKPVPVLQHFFQMIVDEYTNMLDPTCGSGSALRAAEALGASRMLGLEWNESFAADARNALLVARKLRRELVPTKINLDELNV